MIVYYLLLVENGESVFGCGLNFWNLLVDKDLIYWYVCYFFLFLF